MTPTRATIRGAALTLCACATLALAQPAPPPTTPDAAPPPEPRRLDLHIARDGWGDADLDDVEAVLRSAGDQLTRWYGPAPIERIRVQPTGGPIVLFQRADDGAVVMKLNTGDKYWAQYAFQFAHELCHVLCRYDDDVTGHDWFEETLCEVASLFVLRRMGEAWETDPPYENWKSFAPPLRKYAQERIDARPLPQGMTLAQWYAEHAEVLRRNPARRPLNETAAGVLLPMFEAEPQHWAAVAFLNHDRPGRVQTLGEYLGAWRRHAPDEHHAFIDRIAAEFGVRIVTIDEDAQPGDD